MLFYASLLCADCVHTHIYCIVNRLAFRLYLHDPCREKDEQRARRQHEHPSLSNDSRVPFSVSAILSLLCCYALDALHVFVDALHVSLVRRACRRGGFLHHLSDVHRAARRDLLDKDIIPTAHQRCCGLDRNHIGRV